MAQASDHFLNAMRLLTRLNCAQYLLSNLRKRPNGALKAHHHEQLTRLYVAAVRGVDPDLVRRIHDADYHAVHDATAAELTNQLDQIIAFDLDGDVGDRLIERFFRAFHRIALRVLIP
ncbi:hypothetical protein [Mesorhizobium sp. M7A.F.Ca.MR.362.00.0.0]|uniref:hypothetical protein n=1 Tax=Mesorhizobium sp. M7A.F.Ca.MR.362.00.0.0 TaxID=2496779 RepID=UPI000FD5F465|nr:hypothetical protein [Mesorhizobium sp. M7A.F.Ca.MR.362.00.0.0]RUU78234.1 hypothetical protein EOC06_20680 [Mesorhizobium sp. M7A.F.Ca.MR.362.00.0.0]RWN95424.1 MAG: hypothetical protein EOS05_11565 [Mesorhizobium sp.]